MSFSVEQFEQKVWGAVRKHNLIAEGDGVCAAVSGGADSMALLYFLHKYRGRLKGLSAVNIDHGIRGEESARDSEFVRGFCEERDIPLYFYKLDVPEIAKREKAGIEEAARKARYNAFEEILAGGNKWKMENGKWKIMDKKYDVAQTLKSEIFNFQFSIFNSIETTDNITLVPDKLATAHHMNDNAESVLLNLFRGGGARGLAGMEYARGKYIRPFLDVTRAEIEEYAKAEQIPFVTDSTNADTGYARNFVRREILARAEGRFPGAAERIAAAAGDIGRDDEFLNGLAAGYVVKSIQCTVYSVQMKDNEEEVQGTRYKVQGNGQENSLDCPLIPHSSFLIPHSTKEDSENKLLSAGLKDGETAISLSVLSEPALAARAVFIALRGAGIYADIERRHIDIILNFARDGRNGASLDLPGGLKVRKEYGRIALSLREKVKNKK